MYTEIPPTQEKALEETEKVSHGKGKTSPEKASQEKESASQEKEKTSQEKASQEKASQEKEKSPSSDTECAITRGDGDSLGKSDTSAEDEISSDSGYKPKTPSTAERRKVFEVRSNSKENEPEENFDTTDQSSNFERASAQRNSIAERRRMYENRSQSVVETTTNTVIEKPEGSPVLMRRKDSLKNRKNTEVLKEDNNRKSMPIAKQQSVDPQMGKKIEIGTPTPKRTSTVFGKFLIFTWRHIFEIILKFLLPVKT